MRHKRYLSMIFPLMGFALIGCLSFMHPDWLLMEGIFTAVSGYFLLFICFSPAGSLVLGEREERLPLWQWGWKLSQGQMALLLLTMAAVVVFFGGGPSFTEEEKLSLTFAQGALKEYVSWWGIFPWGVYGIWGLAIAYVVYFKKGAPYIYQIARGFCTKRLEPIVKTYAEAATNGATVMAFSLTAVIFILLIAYLIEILFHIRHFEVPFITITVLSLPLPIFSFRFFRKIRKFNVTLRAVYTFFILLLVPVVILAAFGNDWFIRRYPEFYKITFCHQCGNYFANIPLEKRFAAFYWGWWLVWTPLAGAYLASISKGRTLREWVGGLYLFPLILFILINVKGELFFEILIEKTRALPVPFILCFLILFVGLFLSRLTKGWKTTQVFFSGVMPVSVSLPANRLWLKDGSKVVGITKYVPRLVMATVGTLFLHTTAGWYGLQFQLAAMGFLMINLIYSVFNCLALHFIKDRIFLANQNIPVFETVKR